MKNLFIKTKLDSVINVTRIVTVHYFEYQRTFDFPGEKHDFWELVYVDKGSVKIRAEEREFLLSQGEICFHQPNEFHAIRSHRSSPNIIVLSFVCNSAAMKFFTDYRAVVPEHLRYIIADLMREANATFTLRFNDVSLRQLDFSEHPVFGGAQLIKNYLEELLIKLIRNSQTPDEVHVFSSSQRLQNHLVEAIQKYVDLHIFDKITVADICTTFHYGKTTLSKTFRSHAGCGIAEFCARRKIEKAKDLLRENSANISTISDMLGFDNPQYFSQVFRRISGMTPSEYRRTMDLPEFHNKA